jgi:hypothetical protein
MVPHRMDEPCDDLEELGVKDEEVETPRDPVPRVVEGPRNGASLSSSGFPPKLEREAENIVRLLSRKLGHEEAEAREMVDGAIEKLAGIGRPPTGEEILNTALRGRVALFAQGGVGEDFASAKIRRNSLKTKDLHFGSARPGAAEAGAAPETGHGAVNDEEEGGAPGR